MFSLHVLEIGQGLFLEDKVDDRKLHVAYGNLMLLIFS